MRIQSLDSGGGTRRSGGRGALIIVPTAARCLGLCSRAYYNSSIRIQLPLKISPKPSQIMKTTSLLSQFRASRPNTYPLRFRQNPSSRLPLRYNNRPQGQQQRRQGYVRAEDPNFVSIVDHPPRLVRAGRKHGPGLIVLGLYIFLSPDFFSLPSFSYISTYKRRN